MQSSPARPPRPVGAHSRLAKSLPPIFSDSPRSSGTPDSARQRSSFYNQDPSRFSTPRTPLPLENDPDAAEKDRAFRRSSVKVLSRWHQIEDRVSQTMADDSDDDEVDLLTMTVYKRDGQVDSWKPRETRMDSSSDGSDAEGSVSLEEDDGEGDSDRDELDDWSEQEEEVRTQEVLRRMRSSTLGLQAPTPALDEDLADFQRLEALRKAKAKRPDIEHGREASSATARSSDSHARDATARKPQQRLDPRQWGTRFTQDLNDLFGDDGSSGEDEIASSPPRSQWSSPIKPAIAAEKERRHAVSVAPAPSRRSLTDRLLSQPTHPVPEDVLARARQLRKGILPLDSPSSSIVPSPLRAHHTSSHVGANQAGSSASPRPTRTYWQHKDRPRSVSTATSAKGKERMIGERPSEDPGAGHGAGHEDVTRDQLSASRKATAKRVSGKHSAAGRPPASTTKRRAEDTSSENTSLDPFYYRSKTYSHPNSDQLRRCRLCNEAGGVRAERSAYCRGNNGSSGCRFGKAVPPHASGPPSSRATQAARGQNEPDIASDPVPPSHQAGTRKPFNPPLHQNASEPSFNPLLLDSKRYFSTEVHFQGGEKLRRCAYCRVSDDPVRRERDLYCRGRVSAIHCTFDGHKGSLRPKSRAELTANLALAPPAASPPTVQAVIPHTPNSPYLDRPHVLHNGGRKHCKACRAAGGIRDQHSALCKGRTGVSHCLFEAGLVSTETVTEIRITASRKTGRAASTEGAEPKRAKTAASASSAYGIDPTAKSTPRARSYPVIDLAADDENEVSSPERRSATNASLYTATRTNSAMAKASLRPTESQPQRTIARARPRSASAVKSVAEAQHTPNVDGGGPASHASTAKQRYPTFDVVIPVRKIGLVRRRQSEPALAKSVEPVSPASSPDIRPRHLAFGLDRAQNTASSPLDKETRLSSPLPPSSPPVETVSAPTVRAAPPKPPMFRPTPPVQVAYRFDQSRQRSDSVASSSARPFKSSLRQSSEMSDTPRPVKRARISLTPQFQGDDNVAAQLSSRTVPTRWKPDDTNDDGDSSDDELLLTDSITSQPSTSTPQWTARATPPSSSIGADARPNSSPRTATFVHNTPGSVATTTPAKAGLMLPPPIPTHISTPAPPAQKLARSDPRPTTAGPRNIQNAVATPHRRRAQSLSHGVREKVLGSIVFRTVPAGASVR